MGADTPPFPLASVPDPAPTGKAPRDRPEAPALPPLLIDMDALSQLLARSEASLYRDDAAGRIPAGRKLGGSKRWLYSEIVAWVEAGMPCRATWEAMKNASRSGRTR